MKFFCIPIFACKGGIRETFDYSQLRLEEVPKEIFKSRKIVEELLLSFNSIEVLPPELFRCTKLRVLDVSENKLKVIPPEIGALQALAELNLSKNEFVELPEEIGLCRSLISLDLSSNIGPGLVKLPTNIVKLVSLASLNVSNNALTQLPQDVDLLVNLQYLDAGQCELRFLPAAAVALSKLRVLDLCENYLTDLPEGMGGLLSLEVLDLHNNMIGSLPDDVLHCKALRTLDLSNNNLHSMPENLGDLENLTELVLSDNQITSLPSSIGKLKKLEVLKVSKNSLMELTPAICSCSELTDIVLCDNQLKELPSSLGNLKNLKFLDVNVNQLRDIPGTIGGCSSLGVLSLRHNQIRELPMEIGRLDKMQVLDLTDNNLTYLPYTITVLYQYKTLTALWLSFAQPPLPKLTVTHEPVMNVKVLTCYLLPQRGNTNEARPLSRPGVVGGPRVRWTNDVSGEAEDPELEAEDKSKLGKFPRLDTPHPKPFAPKNRLSRNSGDFTNALSDANGDASAADTNTAQSNSYSQIEPRPLRSVLKRPPSTTATQLYQSDASDPSLATKTLRITREEGGIGWHIMGGLDSPPYKGKTGIFISHLVAGSAACKAGFQVDDRIISVNGVTLSGVTHSEAVEIILGSGETLDVVIERHAETYEPTATTASNSSDAQVPSDVSAFIPSRSVDSLPSLHTVINNDELPSILHENRETVSVNVYRDLSGRPGFCVMGCGTHEDPFYISSLESDDHELVKSLRVGDRLLSVNGVNVKSAKRAELDALLHGSPGCEMYLVIERKSTESRNPPVPPRRSAFSAVGGHLSHARSLPSLVQSPIIGHSDDAAQQHPAATTSARSTANLLSAAEKSWLPEVEPTSSGDYSMSNGHASAKASSRFIELNDQPLAASSPIPPSQHTSKIPRPATGKNPPPPPPPKPKRIPDRSDFCSKLQKFEQQISAQSSSSLPPATNGVRNGSGIPAKKKLVSEQDLQKMKEEEATKLPPLAVLDEMPEANDDAYDFDHILNNSPVPTKPAIVRTKKAEVRAGRAGDCSSPLNCSAEVESIMEHNGVTRTPSSLSSIEQRELDLAKRQAWRQARLQSMDVESKRTDEVIKMMTKIPASPEVR